MVTPFSRRHSSSLGLSALLVRPGRILLQAELHHAAGQSHEVFVNAMDTCPYHRGLGAGDDIFQDEGCYLDFKNLEHSNWSTKTCTLRGYISKITD